MTDKTTRYCQQTSHRNSLHNVDELDLHINRVMNQNPNDTLKECDQPEFNGIVRNFKTVKVGWLLSLLAKIKTFLFFIFCTRKFDRVSKIKLIMTPSKIPSGRNYSFESKCGFSAIGLKFSISTKGGFSIISAIFFEPLVYRFMSSIKGDVFVDVGANVGAYSILNSPRFTKVIALEPGQAQRMLLNENIKLNNISNIDVLGKALSQNEGTVKLYKSENLVNYSTAQESNDYETVDSITLDHLLSNFKHVELLKIDVEGAELEVISSGLREISKVHFIILEVRNSYFEEIVESLNHVGFRYHVLEDRTIGEKNILFVNTALE